MRMAKKAVARNVNMRHDSFKIVVELCSKKGAALLSLPY
jgi:hypothetical protein